MSPCSIRSGCQIQRLHRGRFAILFMLEQTIFNIYESFSIPHPGADSLGLNPSTDTSGSSFSCALRLSPSVLLFPPLKYEENRIPYLQGSLEGLNQLLL